MNGRKVTMTILLCAAMLGIGITPAIFLCRTANAANTTPESNDLAGEIQALRSEIKQLRSEIGDLRTDIAALVNKLQQQPPTSGTTGKQEDTDEKVKIIFTEIPPKGEGANSRGDIAGKVIRAKSPQDYKIVLYAHTDCWYVQPHEDATFTNIQSDGTWSNWTHLGHRYAALLVRASFRPESKIQSLPDKGGDIIAVVETSAK